jgi:hypothetical protein
MGRVLILRALLLTCGCLAAQASFAELSDRHELTIRLNWNLVDATSPLGAWTDGEPGKLRIDPADSVGDYSRMTLEYRGQLAPQWFAHAVVDYIDPSAQAVGATEAYVEWRPLPTGPSRHRFRFGAFYPEFSYENSDFAWESPYSRSFSAVNAWIGEEIRPIGAGWHLTRPIGGQGSPQEFGAFAGAFVGNDTAATLLFWRGWAVHDRQTRLNERLALPTLVYSNGPGSPDTRIPRQLDPIAEIDDAPGYYLGSEWSYSRRVKLSLAYWDNQADPEQFRNGQWAWDTRFWHFAAQAALPGSFGVIAQYMRGDTDWLINVTSSGTTTPNTALATDEFESMFLLFSRPIGERHRLSLRLDNFDIWREAALEVDHGDAITIAYEIAINRKLKLRAEWMEIDSARDLWPIFYGRASNHATERQIQLGFDIVLFDSTD